MDFSMLLLAVGFIMLVVTLQLDLAFKGEKFSARLRLSALLKLIGHRANSNLDDE